MDTNRHAPYSVRVAASDAVFLCIHGIMGSPSHFRFLTDTIQDTYSVESILLPGHGGDSKAFSQSHVSEFQAYVDAKIEALQKEYKHIILVGHSMGCLLSIQAACTYPNKIRGLFLMAIPLRIHLGLTNMKNGWRLLTGKEDEVLRTGKDLTSVALEKPSDVLHILRPNAELLEKIRVTRRQLKNLTIPICVVQSSYDELVVPGAEKPLEQLPNASLHILPHATHYYYPTPDRTEILTLFQQFIHQVLPE